ncbi:MAG: hypothetical protein J5I41_07015 [Saprospiraceae bacterium]|nr:hypothetical protein [Saprospiraceae bacterium]
MVFTESFHRKRGTCCGSGCRHCPWNTVDAQGLTPVSRPPLPHPDDGPIHGPGQTGDRKAG